MQHKLWMIPVGVAVLATGCGGDDIAEKIVENRIESGSGENVDLDFDDGSFSIQTEEGSIEFDMNGDGDGTFTIEGVDGEGGEFSVDSDDGVTVIESDEGTATFTQGGDLPDGFPDVPMPDDYSIIFTNEGATGTGEAFMVVATAPGDFAEYLQTLTGYLESNGYTQLQLTTTPDGALFTYEGAENSVSGTVGNDSSGATDGGMSISLQIQPNG